MDLQIINKLYLELSQIATVQTVREIDLERKLDIDTTEDCRVVSELVLRGDDNKLGQLIRGLGVDFNANTNTLCVRYQDGKECRVIIKFECEEKAE